MGRMIHRGDEIDVIFIPLLWTRSGVHSCRRTPLISALKSMDTGLHGLELEMFYFFCVRVVCLWEVLCKTLRILGATFHYHRGGTSSSHISSFTWYMTHFHLTMHRYSNHIILYYVEYLWIYVKGCSPNCPRLSRVVN